MNIKVIGEDKKLVNNFSSLVERTNKENPKEKDMQELKAYFDNDPAIALHIGNINKTVFDSILETLVGESALRREAMQRYISNMESELGYHTSTFVERMLIDEIVMRWIRLQVMENDHKVNTYAEHTFRKGLYYDKRLHLAQARYLKAIATLAKVRKMIAATQAKGAEMFKNLITKEDKKDT